MTIATTTCDIAASASNSAGSHGRLPVSRVRPSAPSANRPIASAMRERELTRERARDVPAVDLPVVARLHEHARRRDRERGRRRPRRAEATREGVRTRGQEQRARNRDQLERDVVADERQRLEQPHHDRGQREVVVTRRGTRHTSQAPNPTGAPSGTSCRQGTSATRRGRPCRRRWWWYSGRGRRDGCPRTARASYPD